MPSPQGLSGAGLCSLGHVAGFIRAATESCRKACGDEAVTWQALLEHTESAARRGAALRAIRYKKRCLKFMHAVQVYHRTVVRSSLLSMKDIDALLGGLRALVKDHQELLSGRLSVVDDDAAPLLDLSPALSQLRYAAQRLLALLKVRLHESALRMELQGWGVELLSQITSLLHIASAVVTLGGVDPRLYRWLRDFASEYSDLRGRYYASIYLASGTRLTAALLVEESVLLQAACRHILSGSNAALVAACRACPEPRGRTSSAMAAACGAWPSLFPLSSIGLAATCARRVWFAYGYALGEHCTCLTALPAEGSEGKEAADTFSGEGWMLQSCQISQAWIADTGAAARSCIREKLTITASPLRMSATGASVAAALRRVTGVVAASPSDLLLATAGFSQDVAGAVGAVVAWFGAWSKAAASVGVGGDDEDAGGLGASPASSWLPSLLRAMVVAHDASCIAGLLQELLPHLRRRSLKPTPSTSSSTAAPPAAEADPDPVELAEAGQPLPVGKDGRRHSWQAVPSAASPAASSDKVRRVRADGGRYFVDVPAAGSPRPVRVVGMPHSSSAAARSAAVAAAQQLALPLGSGSSKAAASTHLHAGGKTAGLAGTQVQRVAGLLWRLQAVGARATSAVHSFLSRLLIASFSHPRTLGKKALLLSGLQPLNDVPEELLPRLPLAAAQWEVVGSGRPATAGVMMASLGVVGVVRSTVMPLVRALAAISPATLASSIAGIVKACCDGYLAALLARKVPITKLGALQLAADLLFLKTWALAGCPCSEGSVPTSSVECLLIAASGGKQPAGVQEGEGEESKLQSLASLFVADEGVAAGIGRAMGRSHHVVALLLADTDMLKNAAARIGDEGGPMGNASRQAAINALGCLPDAKLWMARRSGKHEAAFTRLKEQEATMGRESARVALCST